MDISPDQLAQIARQLTPAQRRAVLAGGLSFGRGYWPLLHALQDLGLIEPAFGTNPLSPLGLALRAHLQKETSK